MHFVDTKPFVKDYRDQRLSAPTFYSSYGSKHVKSLVMSEPSIAFDRLPLMLMFPVLVRCQPGAKGQCTTHFAQTSLKYTISSVVDCSMPWFSK